MYDGMRSTNKWAAPYFTTLMAFGLFNLLVAILVEGFTNSGVNVHARGDYPGFIYVRCFN